MAELHETLMGRKLIEQVFPDIADNLAKIATAMEQQTKIFTESTIQVSICFYEDEDGKKVYDIDHMEEEFTQKLKELTS
jgi:hypothetical protein